MAATIAIEVAICGTVIGWRIGWPSVSTLFATLFALAFTLVAQLPVAKWASLSFPRKLECGSSKGQRQPAVSGLLMLGPHGTLATTPDSGVVPGPDSSAGSAGAGRPRTSFLANRVVLGTLSGIARRRRDQADRTRWDPSLPLFANRPERRPGQSRNQGDS